MRTVLQCLGVAIASIALTAGAFLLYAIVVDARDRARKTVPFSELLFDVEAGQVDDIRVEGTLYTFRMRRPSDGKPTTRATLGPPTDEAQLRTLRPTDPTLPAPSVSVR